jgi:hypothetical protein
MSDSTIPGAAAHLDNPSSYASDASCVEGGPRHLSPTSGRILRALGFDRVATCRELTVELGIEPARCLVALDRLVEAGKVSRTESDPFVLYRRRAPLRDRRKLRGALDGLVLWVSPDGSAELRTELGLVLLHIDDDPVRVVWFLADHSEPPNRLSWKLGTETTRRHIAVLVMCLDSDGVSPGRDLLRYLDDHPLSG